LCITPEWTMAALVSYAALCSPSYSITLGRNGGP